MTIGPDGRTRPREAARTGSGELSEAPEGEGWWIASDGKWYPPHLHPDVLGSQEQPGTSSSSLDSGEPGGTAEAAAVADSPREPAESADRGGSPWPGWEEVAADQGLTGPSRTESLAYPEGWWLASDGNWYPPDLKPGDNGHARPGVMSSLGGRLLGGNGEPIGVWEEEEVEAGEPEGTAGQEPAAAVAALDTEPPAPVAPDEPALAESASVTAVFPGPQLASAAEVAPGEPPTTRRGRLLVLTTILLLLLGGAIAGVIVATSSSTPTAASKHHHQHHGLTPAQRAARTRALAQQRIARDSRDASKIVLRLADVPAGWLRAAPLPASAPRSADPFETAQARAKLAAANPSCRSVAATFSTIDLGADATSVTAYQTPLGGSTPAFGSLKTQVIFFPGTASAGEAIARLWALSPKSSCVAAAVRLLLGRSLPAGTVVRTHVATGRPTGLANGQAGFMFVVTGTMSRSGATYPLRFVIEGAGAERAIALFYSGSVANGGGSSQLDQALFAKLSQRIYRFDPVVT